MEYGLVAELGDRRIYKQVGEAACRAKLLNYNI